MTAFAITQSEWEADNSLLPSPSASSAFYFVAPTLRNGEQTVTGSRTGLDATPTEREYAFQFGTALSTFKPGSLFILR